MSIESIQYETYIIIGAIVLLFFIYSVYITKFLIEKIKTIGKDTESTKTTYKAQKEEEIHMLINDIRNNIDILKEEVDISEKERIYDEKDKIIHDLQQKIITIESTLQNGGTTIMIPLQQRLQEIEHKYKRVLLLHKTITEKEKIKDTMVAEKERYIYTLQQQLYDSQRKLEHMIISNEENKEKLLERKFVDIEKQIQTEKDRNQTYGILVILGILILYLWSIA